MNLELLDRREDVERTIRRACDWQLANLPAQCRSVLHQNPLELKDNGWIRSAFFTGVMAAFRATGDRKYLEAARAWGGRNGWRPGSSSRHADDHCCGQTYLELFLLERDPAMIEAIREVFDAVVADRRPGPVAGWANNRNWAWCDALFMAPPAMARLAAATGRRRYLDTMNAMWWETHAYLYNEGERLFYRDGRFKPAAAAKDPPVFWSRGNGWVLAGLARVLEYIPEDYPDRPRYLHLFRDMAARVTALQPADGLWRTNLLEPDAAPDPETSGSGFFCYGLAWGINHGLLPGGEYLPAAAKAWRALRACLDEEGCLHRVQLMADRPSAVAWEHTVEYGVGAFLLAGSEIAELGRSRKTAF